jgi:hypothetical protein
VSRRRLCSPQGYGGACGAEIRDSSGAPLDQPPSSTPRASMQLLRRHFFGLLVFGPAITLAFVTATVAALTGIAEHESGLASGLNNTARQIGAALGVPIVSTVAVSRKYAGPKSIYLIRSALYDSNRRPSTIAVRCDGSSSSGLAGHRLRSSGLPAGRGAPCRLQVP